LGDAGQIEPFDAWFVAHNYITLSTGGYDKDGPATGQSLCTIWQYWPVVRQEDRIAAMIVPNVEIGSPRFAAENAHTASAVEWWFFHGHYDGPVSGRRFFMATLFRMNLDVYDGGVSSSFELMLAILDPDKATAGHESATWIDRQLLRKSIEKLKTKDAHIDPVVQQAFAQEIEAHGPPHPIVLKPEPQVFKTQPLRVEWDEFALAERETGFDIAFREPDSGRMVCLHLAAAASRMDVACESQFVPLGSTMAYSAYPRVRLTGFRDADEELTGQAWMDHQWGDTNWFRDAQAGVMLGWDWFGINFDDGSDLLVMRHRNARSGQTVGMHATFRAQGGSARTAYQLTLTPLRDWFSPATFIEYPVAWRIEVPEFDVVLVFEPRCDGQEIASFGTMRAVWEGAGTVSGTMHGAAVSGTARGEFHGYGYVFDHQDLLKSMGRRVDRHLEEFLPRRFDAAQVEKLVGPAQWQHDVDAYTEMLSVPVWDLVDRSGKRWRPIFGILLLEALGVSSRPYEGLISCLDFIHAGALIIDDIEDDSLLRRGQECIHLRYGVDVAINAGNTLYFLPGAAVIRHPLLTPETRRRALEIKERVSIEAHCGQATDIFWSRKMAPDYLRRLLEGDVESKILQMYAFKTASAAAGVAEFVAAIADVSREITQACADFARLFGVAYQIVDDIHNFSRSADWTKVTGEDLANGKLTLVIAKALRRLAPADSARLQAILCSRELRGQPSILAEGVELVYRSGALDLCREMAKSMVNDAWGKLSPRLRSSEPKIMLHAMCLKLIELAYDG
jgi:geranylgeranyl pyrophosphate synthase/predicted secreted hydrolase